jgi:glycosyltransferase involved in cell wall biosynthesis
VEAVDLSVVMPCLNEAETLARCIEKARLGIERARVSGEVIVADNGSTDGSQAIAERLGARVVPVSARGYGNALRGGIHAARGRWIVMGDADDSYDFSELTGFVEKLRAGADLVMGCRLPAGGGAILPGAMPWKNRWIGNPVLSRLGRLLFRAAAHDFHCGLRAFSKAAYERMDLNTAGMEFASEMLMKATLAGMRVEEVPITLHPDGRSRPPHLRPWRDGWRHLRFMLIYSPRWLFLMPGLLMFCLGAIAATLLSFGPLTLGGVVFDVGTLAGAAMLILTGAQFMALACFTKVFGIAQRLLPDDPKFASVLRVIDLERGLAISALLLLAGAAKLLHAIWLWRNAGYGAIPYDENLRRIIPAVTLIVLAIQGISWSFFMSVLGLKTDTNAPPEPPASG